MSTATTVLGMLPLVVFPGAGSELYRGIGSVVIGGLICSSIFTLFLVPRIIQLGLQHSRTHLAKSPNLQWGAGMRFRILQFIAGLSLLCIFGCKTAPVLESTRSQLEAASLRSAADLPQQLEQGTLVLSIDHCLELALGGNLELQLAALTPRIRGEDFYLANEFFQTKFYATYSQGSREEQTANSQIGADVLEADVENWEVGLRKTWKPGTRTDLKWAMEENEDNSTFRTLNPSYDSSILLEVVHPLLGGFGVNVNRAELDKAINRKAIAEAEFELTLEGELLSVYRRYWKLSLAAEEWELEKTSAELAREQVAITEDQLHVGRAASLDLTRAQASLARQIESLTAAETRYESASDQLLQQILPEQWPAYLDLRVIPSSDLAPIPDGVETPTLKAAFSNAVQDRAELSIANLELNSAQLDVLLAKNRRLPRLDLVGSYGFTGLGGSQSASRNSLQDQDFPVWSIGVELEFFFLGESRAARFRQSVLQEQSETLQQQKALSLILFDVRTALQGVTSAEKQYLAASRSAALFKEQYEGERDRLDVGKSTLFETEQARRDLLDAERNQLRARVDIEISQAILQAAQGHFAVTIIESISTENPNAR